MLWLWRMPAATALIQSLAWEPPYATDAGLKKKKKKGKEKKKYYSAWCIKSMILGPPPCLPECLTTVTKGPI